MLSASAATLDGMLASDGGGGGATERYIDPRRVIGLANDTVWAATELEECALRIERVLERVAGLPSLSA
jgi:hypothetical protein